MGLAQVQQICDCSHCKDHPSGDIIPKLYFFIITVCITFRIIPHEKNKILASPPGFHPILGNFEKTALPMKKAIINAHIDLLPLVRVRSPVL
jgi:hypothetical protein